MESMNTPNEVCLELEKLLLKIQEMKSHKLENEIISLSPSSFDTLKDFFKKIQITKVVAERILNREKGWSVGEQKEYWIEKRYGQLVLSMLSK